MDSASHLAALEASSAAIAELAGGNLDARVPACPEWDVGDLVGHLGGVYSFVAMVAEAGGRSPEGEREQPPSDREQLISWFETRRHVLLSALTAAGPDQPAWVFVSPSPRTVAWWRRRQAMETTVHRVDVEQAVGTAPVVEPELAADGIDELLTEMLPLRWSRRPVEGLEGTLHVHCTDTEGEWLVQLSGQGVEVRREHAKGDMAARGPASGLYLWLWNRLTPDAAGIEVFGDTRLAEMWSRVKI